MMPQTNASSEAAAFIAYINSIDHFVENVDALERANGNKALLAKLREQLRADLHAQNVAVLAAAEKQTARVDEFLSDIANKSLSSQELDDLSGLATHQLRVADEEMAPALESLRAKIAKGAAARDVPTENCFQENVATLNRLLSLHRRLSANLLKLVADRRSVGGETLRARPVEGEIDHEALSREFMARFPRLRAALAK
jgi:hypothetical protein